MKLTDIVLDPQLQMRDSLDGELINEYSESIKEGSKFPPLEVFHDGSSYFLVDGWHRYYAYKKAGIADVEVKLHKGTLRAARLYATGVNDDHGARRSPATKRKIVMVYLDDVEWAEWSSRDIAKHSKLSHTFIEKVRKSLGLQKNVVKSVQNGKVVEVKVNRKNEDAVVQEEAFEDEVAEKMAAIVEDNEVLTRRLAVAAMEATDDEKKLASEQLEEMASKIKGLEASNHALTTRLNTELNKTSDMLDQVKYWKRRAEKAEKKLKEAGL